MFLSANDMEDLYHSNLYINVATMQNDREIGGRIVAQLIGPAHELADHPILIAGESNRFAYFYRMVLSMKSWIDTLRPYFL